MIEVNDCSFPSRRTSNSPRAEVDKLGPSPPHRMRFPCSLDSLPSQLHLAQTLPPCHLSRRRRSLPRDGRTRSCLGHHSASEHPALARLGVMRHRHRLDGTVQGILKRWNGGRREGKVVSRCRRERGNWRSLLIATKEGADGRGRVVQRSRASASEEVARAGAVGARTRGRLRSDSGVGSRRGEGRFGEDGRDGRRSGRRVCEGDCWERFKR